jgi:prolyl 4-hydroxylase
MTEKWYPQRSTKDAPIAILKTFMHHVGYPISRKTIEKTLEEHPSFPELSFEEIVQILNSWGMEAMAFSITIDKLSLLPIPSITLLHETYREIKLGVLVLYFGVIDNEVRYLHPRKGWCYSNIEDFSKIWSCGMISLTGITGNGEADFEQLESEYNKRALEKEEMHIIECFDNVLSTDECDYIINLSKDKYKRSQVGIDDDAEQLSEGRTSFSAYLPFPEHTTLNEIRKKIGRQFELSVERFEHFQCVAYANGQEYQAHFDTFDPETKYGKESMVNGGQREYTLLVYLNDEFEGGQTYFPNLDVVISPKKGRAVLFKNIDENGNIYKGSYHAGLPVAKGQKYAFNLWIRENAITDHE